MYLILAWNSKTIMIFVFMTWINFCFMEYLFNKSTNNRSYSRNINNLNTTLKILTKDPTLLNYSFVFSSTNPEKLVTPIVDNIINIGKPGTSSSYISIQTGKQNKEIYLTSSSNRSLFFKIKIIK